MKKGRCQVSVGVMNKETLITSPFTKDSQERAALVLANLVVKLSFAKSSKPAHLPPVMVGVMFECYENQIKRPDETDTQLVYVLSWGTNFTNSDGISCRK